MGILLIAPFVIVVLLLPIIVFVYDFIDNWNKLK